MAALSIVADGLGYELGSVSRSRNEPWQVAAYLGWKVAELAVGWYGKYDGKFQSQFLIFVSNIIYTITDIFGGE